MPFDSGLFYRGALRGGVVEFHAYHLFRQPQALLVRYMAEEMWRVDPFVEAVLTRPGIAHRLAMAKCPVAFQTFLEDHGQRQMISLAIASDALQLVAGLSLYRCDPAHPFNDDEARAYEDIVPHMVDGWTHSWLAELVRSADELEAPFAIAVLTPDTTLTAAQREFESLIAVDWPQWQGPSMPDALREHILANPAAPWYGRRLAIYVEQIDGGRYLLRVRVRQAFDALAPPQASGRSRIRSGRVADPGRQGTAPVRLDGQQLPGRRLPGTAYLRQGPAGHVGVATTTERVAALRP